MGPNPAEAPRGLITDLRAALDAIPADEPRNYLRQSLQLLVPLLEQIHHRLQALERRLEALESGHRRPGDPRQRRLQQTCEGTETSWAMVGAERLPLPEGGGHEHPSRAPMESGSAHDAGHAYRLGVYRSSTRREE